jgi:hypothetical protein
MSHGGYGTANTFLTDLSFGELHFMISQQRLEALKIARFIPSSDSYRDRSNVSHRIELIAEMPSSCFVFFREHTFQHEKGKPFD